MNTAQGRTPGFLHLVIFLALAAMLAASAYSLLKSPDEHGHGAPAAQNGQMPEAAQASDNPAMALNEEQAGGISALMARLQETPNDADTLMEIADIFSAAGEWSRAEVFLARAVLARPGDARPRYALGIAQYQSGQMQEAAKSFEELLSIKEDPAAMYNLAIIYKYHLKKSEQAQELLSTILESPSADSATLVRARKELEDKRENTQKPE